MQSQRHSGGDPLLDAAYGCVMDVGLRRTTLADVARRAGVSRMTVYRAYADLDGLVGALLFRELGDVLAGAAQETADLPTARQRLVEAGVLVVHRTAAHPLLRKVLDLDPELLLPLVVDRFGSTQVAARVAVAEQVREGLADGSIRALDPDVAATCLLLTAQSFVFSARVVAGLDLDDELRHLLDGYLRP